MPKYKWPNAHAWLSHKVDSWNEQELLTNFKLMIANLNGDQIQDEFQHEMDQDGYFIDFDGDTSDEDIEKMWERLTDHPMLVDDPETIQDEFYIWPPGTHREVIWQWVDKKHSKGVHFLMHGEDADNA